MDRFSAVGLAGVLTFLAGEVRASDLLGVYQDARLSDPQIRQADANRLASREARPQAIAALLPQINGTASVGRDQSDGVQTTPVTLPDGSLAPVAFNTSISTSSRQWALNLRQNVFSWANWMTLRQADGQVAEAEATYAAAEQSLILRVAQAYFAVLAAIDNLDAQQASLEAISRQLDQANKRFEVGLIAITDVEEAQAARDTAAAAVIAAKRTLATTEDQLSEITGRKYDALSRPGTDLPLTMPEPASEDRWVELSMEQNLSLIASRLSADIARDNVHVAFGGHLPTIDLVASRSYSQNTSAGSLYGENISDLLARTNDKQISLQLTVPIFSGGLQSSRVREAQYRWIAAKEAVVQSSRATERQARDAYLGVISGIARVKALRQALESSQTALKATEAGYDVGTRTAVDLLNARRALVQAQTDYSGSRYDYIVSMIQLKLAAGNLDQGQLTTINAALTSPAPTAPSASPTPESLTPPGAATAAPAVPINPTTVRPPEGTQQPAGREPRR